MDRRRNTLIKCGSLIDGTGSPAVEGVSVLIDGERIAAVGRDISPPPHTAVIDAGDMTVMPGLVDAQVHHTGGLDDEFAMGWEWVTRPNELRLISSVQDSRAFLSSGFTTVRDCGSMNAIFLRESAAEGTLAGVPRIVAAGYVLTQTFGHMDIHSLPPACVDPRTSSHNGRLDSLVCDGAPECIEATRYALRAGADFIMICASGGVVSEGDSPCDVQFNPDEIRAIVDTAAQAGKSVVAHTLNSRGAKNCIEAGVASIVHSFDIDDEVIELGKDRGTVFTSTLGIAMRMENMASEGRTAPWVAQKAKGHFESAVDTYTRMRRAGAVLAAGTILAGAQELELLVKHCGFSPMEAIVAATKHGAMACFLGADTGTLEVGKSADLLIVDGDPLGDISILQDERRIVGVLLAGRSEVRRIGAETRRPLEDALAGATETGGNT